MIPQNTKEIEVIDMYDGEALIHIREDDAGQRYYCHALYWDLVSTTYIMVPVSDGDIVEIKDNKLDLRTVIDRRPAFLLSCGRSDAITECVDPLPEDCLPKSGVTLYPPGI